MPKQPHPLSSIQLRQFALDALMDERTFRKTLVGGRVLPTTRERVRRVLEARGLQHLLPRNVEESEPPRAA